MIVPQDRLIFCSGAIIVPLSIVEAIRPESLSAVIGGITAFLAVVTIDAVLSRKMLKGLTPQFPETVVLKNESEGFIKFYVNKNSAEKKVLKIGLPFPREISPQSDALTLTLPAGEGRFHYDWPCRPLKRGRYLFDKCFLECRSRFGFWAVRTAAPAGFDIRVYPSLASERKSIATLFLNKGNLGVHSQRKVGQGREFEKLRDYIYGDSYDQIHWKATAKRGSPVTKLFRVERTQEVYLVIDASRLSARAASDPGASDRKEIYPQTVLERYLTATAIMKTAAQIEGDLFGLITFSDNIHTFVRAKRGREHYNTCRDAIYQLQPRTVTPNFEELIAFIGLKLRRRALLIFLTNLDDPALAEGFQKGIELISRKHLVFVNMLQPMGVRPLFSNQEAATIDDIYQDLGGHLAWHKLVELEKDLKRRGVRFSLLNNEKICSQLVSHYIEVKQRQLL